MWYSDKPRPQQRLADTLAKLCYETVPTKDLVAFEEAFWVVMGKKWPELDHHRLDKFLMLARKVVYYSLKRLLKEDWNSKLLKQYNKMLDVVFEDKYPTGLSFHVSEIYWDELERVAADENLDVKEFPVAQLLGPFQKCADETRNRLLKECVTENVLQSDKLVAWGVVEDSDDDDEDEWHGF